MFKEFREFAIKGNAIDLAIAVVFGAAFGAIVTSLVTDIINPFIGLALGKTDLTNLFVVLSPGKQAGPYGSLQAARDAGASVLAYGAFLNALVSFLLIALVLFFVVKAINRLKRPEAVSEKDCPYCLTPIPLAATKCSACTADLPA